MHIEENVMFYICQSRFHERFVRSFILRTYFEIQTLVSVTVSLLLWNITEIYLKFRYFNFVCQLETFLLSFIRVLDDEDPPEIVSKFIYVLQKILQKYFTKYVSFNPLKNNQLFCTQLFEKKSMQRNKYTSLRAVNLFLKTLSPKSYCALCISNYPVNFEVKSISFGIIFVLWRDWFKYGRLKISSTFYLLFSWFGIQITYDFPTFESTAKQTHIQIQPNCGVRLKRKC